MSMLDCIGKLMKVGRLTKSQAETVAKEAERLENMYKAEGSFPEDSIKAKAENDALEYLHKKLRQQEYTTARQVDTYTKLKDSIATNPKNKEVGLIAELRHDMTGRHNYKHGPSVVDLGTAIYGEATHSLGEAIEKYRAKWPGGWDMYLRSSQEAMTKFYKATRGEAVDDPMVTEFAREYNKINNKLIDRLNRAGVFVNKLENHGIGVNWDQGTVHAAGKEKWVTEVLQRLDRAKMLDASGLRLDEGSLLRLANEAYDNITTGGLSKMVAESKVQGPTGAGGLNSIRSAHRIFNFKSGDDALYMAQKYGTGNIFDNAIGQLKDLSQDIALAEKFGPNPDKTFKLLYNEAKLQQANGEAPKTSFFKDSLVNAEKLYAVVSGKTLGAGNLAAGNIGAASRNWFGVAGMLGSAFLSQPGDFAFIKAQAGLWNMHFAPVLAKVLGAGVNIGKSTKLATRLGQNVDFALSHVPELARMVDADMAGKSLDLSNKMASTIVDASLLGRFTNAEKSTLFAAYGNELAVRSKQSFDKLDSYLQKSFKQYGIGSTEWDIIRAAKSDEPGFKYIDLDKINSNEIKAKYLSMLNNEVRYAIPEPDSEVRAFLTQGASRGTFTRETMGMLMQFKSFATSAALITFRRGLMNPAVGKTGLNKLTFLAKLSVYTTMAGALSLQLKEIAKGRDYMSTEDPEFWVKSYLQGGGVGPISDTIYQAWKQERDVGAFVKGLIGPSSGAMAAASLTSMDIMSTLIMRSRGESDNKHLTEEFVKDILKPVVPGNNLWQIKLALDRYIFDTITTTADPSIKNKWKTYEKSQKSKTGQMSYWEKGQPLPSRFPRMNEPGDKK